VLNCRISAFLFEFLKDRGVPTHYLGIQNDHWMVVRSVKVIPIEVVVRNIAAGSLCRQMPIAPATPLDPPLLDLYYKNDGLGDPLLTPARLELLNLLAPGQLERIEFLALQVNRELRSLFASVDLELVDFKIELGFTSDDQLVVADEISPDTCRLWDRRGLAGSDLTGDKDRILDKDRFRQDLGGVVEAYGEVLKRVEGVCPEPMVYR
jgi:phosphoribosylaminoimidazole-succinocarboxamide synthase